MSVFDAFGQHHTIIEIATSLNFPANTMEVVAGTQLLGTVVEVDKGDWGGEPGEFGYQAFTPEGGRLTINTDTFSEAVGLVIGSAGGLA